MKVAKRTYKHFVNDFLFYSLVIEKAARAHNIDPTHTVSNSTTSKVCTKKKKSLAYELEP